MEIYWHFLSFSAYIASLEGLLYLNKKNLPNFLVSSYLADK